FNLKHFLIHRGYMRAQFEKSDDFQEVIHSNQWTLFESKEDRSRYAHVASSLPFLVFSEWKPKNRKLIDDYDFLSLSEYLFLQNRFDVLLAQSPHPLLDEQPFDSRFGGILITSYRYKNRDLAQKKILDYSANKPVILLEDDDPLFTSLQSQIQGH